MLSYHPVFTTYLEKQMQFAEITKSFAETFNCRVAKNDWCAFENPSPSLGDNRLEFKVLKRTNKIAKTFKGNALPG